MALQFQLMVGQGAHFLDSGVVQVLDQALLLAPFPQKRQTLQGIPAVEQPDLVFVLDQVESVIESGITRSDNGDFSLMGFGERRNLV